MNRISACVLVFNEIDEVLSASRRHRPEALGLPGGKVDEGESVVDAAMRELWGETGISLCHEDLIPLYSSGDGTGFGVHTFMCVKTIASNDIIQREPDILVQWVHHERLITESPFSQYNKEILDAYKQRYDLVKG